MPGICFFLIYPAPYLLRKPHVAVEVFAYFLLLFLASLSRGLAEFCPNFKSYTIFLQNNLLCCDYGSVSA